MLLTVHQCFLMMLSRKSIVFKPTLQTTNKFFCVILGKWIFVILEATFLFPILSGIKQLAHLLLPHQLILVLRFVIHLRLQPIFLPFLSKPLLLHILSQLVHPGRGIPQILFPFLGRSCTAPLYIPSVI